MNITAKLFRIFANKQSRSNFEDALTKELSSQQSGSDLIQEIVDNYRYIISKLERAPERVTLDANNLSIITINGTTWDLDATFSHNDRKVTECRMAIECLMADLSSQHSVKDLIHQVEAALNNT